MSLPVYDVSANKTPPLKNLLLFPRPKNNAHARFGLTLERLEILSNLYRNILLPEFFFKTISLIYLTEFSQVKFN